MATSFETENTASIMLIDSKNKGHILETEYRRRKWFHFCLGLLCKRWWKVCGCHRGWVNVQRYWMCLPSRNLRVVVSQEKTAFNHCWTFCGKYILHWNVARKKITKHCPDIARQIPPTRPQKKQLWIELNVAASIVGTKQRTWPAKICNSDIPIEQAHSV